MPKLRPILDRVVIKRDSFVEKKTAGGIILLADHQKAAADTFEGKVLAVGHGRFDTNGNRIPMTIKPGMKVIYNHYTETEGRRDDPDVVTVREDNVLGYWEV